jgi:Transposase DDE domain group 1
VLLRATDRAVGLIDRFAQCFSDSRSEELIEHTVATMIGQRVFGIALGYEDVVDHDTLRHDPIMAVLAGKLTAAMLTTAAHDTLATIFDRHPTTGSTKGISAGTYRCRLVQPKELGRPARAAKRSQEGSRRCCPQARCCLAHDVAISNALPLGRQAATCDKLIAVTAPPQPTHSGIGG